MSPPPSAQAQTDQTPEKTRVGNSIHSVMNVPKIYQIDAISKGIDATVDSTLTGNCDSEELAIIVWILTRINPQMNLGCLRVNFYEELHDCYRTGMERQKDRGLNDLYAI